MLFDLRKIIRALPIRRGKALVIRYLVTLFPFYRYERISVFGHSIKIDLTDKVAIGLYLNFGNVLAEKEIFNMLEMLVGPEDVYWDAGANIGYHTLFLSTKCNVISFEPNPLLYSNLKDALSSYQNVLIFNYALTDKDGKVKFYLNERSSDLASLIDNGEKKHIIIDSRSVDSLVLNSGVKPPTIIKIDVEGFEYFVFNGFKSINQFKPLVIFEFVPQFWSKIDKTLDDIIKLLGSDWLLFRLMHNGLIKAYYQDMEGTTNNYLAVHKDFNRFIKIQSLIDN